MIETKIYKNGLKLIVDKMDNYESVALNMFVKTGSVNEPDGYYGISHLVEHMLFKGTKTRSSLDLSRTFDGLGANVDAYTDREETDFYTKTTSDHVEKCVELFSDMLFNSTFDKKELAREKKVVMEEIKMYEDDASSKAELLVNQSFYNGNPFSRDVGGRIKDVRNLTQKKLFEYKDKYYVPNNITVSFAGNISFKTAQQYIEKYFMPFFGEENEIPNNYFVTPKKVAIVKRYKNNAQSQVCISFAGLYDDDKSRYAAKIFDISFGMGMSSILFQRIREKLGLVYVISSSSCFNCAGGDMTIRFATSTKNIKLALESIADEIKRVRAEGITREQFENARNNYISTVKLNFENTSFVSLFNAKKFGFYGTTMTKDDLVKKIQEAKYEDVLPYLQKVFVNDNFSISMVGNNTKLKLENYFKI